MYLSALFDLAIWNEPYREGGPKFTERFLAIYEDLRNRYFPQERDWMPEGVVAGSYKFSTRHFYSGSVRYHGYVYANMAAEEIAEHLWDTLGLTTGRRTLYRQPSLAGLLIDGLYKRGFTRPLPLAIEEFTGKKFEPLKLIERTNEALGRFVRESANKPSCGVQVKSILL